MNAEDIVVDMIKLNGGRLVEQTRLHKGAYLLHRCGANFDLPFVFHHYDPYLFDLAIGCLNAWVNKRIKIRERTGRHGVRYAISILGKDARPSSYIGTLSAARARRLLKKMAAVEDIVLELAATIIYFGENGYDVKGAVEETKVRKPIKASSERIDRAFSLIRNPDLEPKNELKNEFVPAG